MKYTVQTIRDAGLDCKWSRNSRGAPIIVARKDAGRWYYVDRRMWADMERDGIAEAFGNHTALGEYFSISV